MMNQFTPEESQDFIKNKKITTSTLHNDLKPSIAAMNFIYGYSAALTILKTINFGNVEILLN